MSETWPADPPSPFVERMVRGLAAPAVGSREPRALDVAAGRGRHAATLARAGYRVFVIDRDYTATRQAVARADAAGLHLLAWCADLTSFPLPKNRFELIVVARYLQRDLFPALQDALAPGGVLIYETFTSLQQDRARGPSSPDHLLEPGELVRRFEALELLVYEEVTEPDAYARFCGRKRPASGATAR